MHARRIASMLLAASAAAAVLGTGTAQAAGAGHRIERHRAVVELGTVHRAINARDEWITLTNTTGRTLDLRGWTLSDRDRHSFRIGGLWLLGHHSVRVHTGRGRNTGRDVYQDRSRGLWDRSDTATLRDSRGRLIDQASWGSRDERHDGRHEGRGGVRHDGPGAVRHDGHGDVHNDGHHDSRHDGHH
ncbi:lamin tail domain-containing protein [Peterkaempfera griseoplana]|uniref:lamin tail domain-containing protein n=1 Tax=Peterkaempfera griseoplana TaxID=66896 RepID=UPI0007C712F6|nr:lamin tail domain-containing protein [Peterkaempfera griseoplana]